MFANGPGDLGSILCQVTPDSKKWYLMPPCLALSIIRYGSKLKWSNPGKVVPSPTPWCNSNWKGRLWVTLNYGRQPSFFFLYILSQSGLIGPVGRVFANGWGDLGSIPGRVIPKTLKMVLDTSLLNTQQYQVVSRERSSALPYTSV